VGLAVFFSDALSSTAYATQEILIILAMGGAAALAFVLPISIAIVLLLAIVTFSYEQTIHAYPSGGGAYIVARDNVGELAAQVAGAALLMDYILTVAVSISSAVAQMASAFPSLFPVRVEIAVAFVACVMIVNLRGVKESGAVFAAPTYFFVAMMYLTVGTAFFRHLAGTLAAVPFTLSQGGMAHRWWKSGRLAPGQESRERGSVVRHDPRWALKMGVNGFGAVLTAVVTVVFAATKFRDGAWVVLIVIPTLVVGFYAIHRHYRDLAGRLSLESFGPPPRVDRHRVILPISGVHRGVVAGLTYARALSEDVTAVYVSTDPERTEAVEKKWGQWGGGVRLVVVDSPYRLLVEPLVEYVRQVAARRQPNEVITVVVPQFVPRRQWHNALHAQTAMMLRLALVNEPGLVITSVPYQVGRGEEGPEE
jgi:hypothetical protein